MVGNCRAVELWTEWSVSTDSVSLRLGWLSFVDIDSVIEFGAWHSGKGEGNGGQRANVIKRNNTINFSQKLY